MNKFAVIFLLTTLLAVAAAGFAWKNAGHLRSANEELRAKVAELEGRLDKSKAALEERGKVSEAEFQAQKSELMRLRNEVTQLRNIGSEAARLEAENQRLQARNQQLRGAAAAAEAAPPPADGGNVQQFPRESWKFAGYGTPEAALMSAIWAMKEGQPQTYLDSLSPQEQQRMAQVWQNQTEAQVASKHQQDVAAITGLQITERHSVTPQEMIMTVYLEGPGRTEKVRVRQVGNEWKFGGFIRE